MEFYKLYVDQKRFGSGNGNWTGFCVNELNWDINRNPQWMAEVKSQQSVYCGKDGVMVTILVRWVGLKETPFKEKDDE